MADFFRMTITFKNDCVEDEMETIFDYLSTLYKNGQILNDYQLVKKDNAYFAYLTVPDKNALDPRYDNIYTNKYLHDIETKLDYLGENVDIGECCCCNEPSWYMLYADCASNESPIVCGDCGHEIPLYKIQHIMGEEEHLSILSWQRVYKSIDNIWMNCLSDRFTKRQLCDPNSQLSKTGMKICTVLEKVLKKSVFYFLYQPYQITENCPKCGEKWKKSKRTKTVNFVCDLMKSVFLGKGESFYTYLNKIFNAIDNEQINYNWLITNCESYPQKKSLINYFQKNIFGFQANGLQKLFKRKIFNLFGVFSLVFL